MLSLRTVGIVLMFTFATSLNVVAQTVAVDDPLPPDRHLDAVVEQAETWQTEEPDRVSVSVDDAQTHHTPGALRVQWPKDLGDIAGTGVPKVEQVPSCWVKLPEDLDVSEYTRLSFWAKIAGTRHGHLHVVLSNEPLIWGPTVKCHINNTPLDLGDWRRYLVTLGHIEAEERKQYRWLGLASVNVGHQPDEAEAMDVWLDDFVLTAQPLRKTKGWDADPTVVICNQAGFRRLHEKLAIVHAECTEREFTITAATDSEPVYTGNLSTVRSAVGSYKVARFTQFTQPGRYRVRVGDLKSQPFTIGDDAYEPCIELLSDWVASMRCGCETALHAPCHTDDGTIVNYEGEGEQRKEISRSHLDVAGGWHDAGDVRTYYSYTFNMAYQCLRARESGWLRDRDGDGRDDMLDSARWAMLHLPKIRRPDDGRFFQKMADWPDYRRGNYWTDCKVGTPDDRHIMDLPELVDWVGQACASAGLFARTAQGDLKPVAAAALEAVRERWDVWFDPDTGKKPWRTEPIDVHRHGFHIAKWGQGSLQLHLATDEAVYLEFARLCADRVLSYQRRTFYPGGSRPMCGEIFTWMRTLPNRDLPEEYLADLMLELPRDEDYWRWRAALVRGAEWWMKPTRQFWAPFSVPHLEAPAQTQGVEFWNVPLQTHPERGAVSYLVPTAGSRQVTDTAHGLYRVAQALNDVELEHLALRQLQWVLGLNPFGVSYICDFGDDCIDQFYSFSQGRMPGAVSTGFGIGNAGIPGCVRPYGGETWTEAAARLVRGLASLTQPGRLRLTVRDGDAPWQGTVAIRWSQTGETVFEGRTGNDGVLPQVQLDGGQSYEITCGPLTVPLNVVSGTVVEKTIDLARAITVQAQAPGAVKAGQPFTVNLKVAQLGSQPTEVELSVHAEDAVAEQTTRTVTVGPRETQTVPWTFTAGEADRPYVLCFAADGDRLSYVDATGEIRAE